jgi:hypothetical protein
MPQIHTGTAVLWSISPPAQRTVSANPTAATQGSTIPHQIPILVETVPCTARSTAATDAAMLKAVSQTQGCFPLT